MTSDPGWELPSPDDGPPPPETVQWVEEQLGEAVTNIEPLPGGLSSAIHRLTLGGPIEAARNTDRVVLRRHTNRAWMEREPYIPHHEARTLKLLGNRASRGGESVGVDTPELIAADPDGERCDVPTIVMTEIMGRPELNPTDRQRYSEQLATCLAGIHRVPVPADLEPYRRWDNQQAKVPVWVQDFALWTSAQDRVDGDLPTGTAAFLHRDYHPNNIHWADGEICAVVDWLSACVGPVEADLAHCRWNLAILFDVETAEHFTSHYRQQASQTPGHPGHPERTDDGIQTAYDLSVVLSAPIGPFPTYAWNDLGRPDLTPETVPKLIESWLKYVMGKTGDEYSR